MNTLRRWIFLVGLLAAALPATPADAAYLTWVASYGTDTNNTTCARDNPCLTFQHAHDQTDSNGQMLCLDTGSGLVSSYVTITKSITIDCAAGYLQVFNTIGVTVNGAGIVVKLRNLAMNGSGFGLTGVDFFNGSALILENCLIENFSKFDAFGVRFRPSTAAQLIMTDTIITGNGRANVAGGIVINPQPGGTAQVTLKRVTVAKNVFGVAIDGSGSTGGINMTITDSLLSSNSQDGLVATTSSGGAPIGVALTNSQSVNNTYGLRSIGSNVTIRADNVTVVGNGTGLSFSNGAALLSFGNNKVEANGVNGAFSGVIGMK